MKSKTPFTCLINDLKDDGLPTASKKLSFLYNDMAWTTGSEFQGAFGSEMEKIKQSYWERMSEASQASFMDSAEIILTTWPTLKL